MKIFNLSKINMLQIYIAVAYIIIYIISIYYSLDIGSMAIYYALIMVVTLSWYSYASDEFKRISFVISTCISVLVACYIFDSNVYSIIAVSLLSQFISAMILIMGKLK